MFSKVVECLEQNIRKQINYNRPSSIKQMNRAQNTRIEIRKYKYNQVGVILSGFASTCLY